MWKILMFEISAKKGLCYVICGSEVKTSDLAAQGHGHERWQGDLSRSCRIAFDAPR